jgi:membrane-associated PAP2 superfamily phosphatase
MSSPLSREAVVDSRTQGAALVGTGILVWLVATLLFRLVGQFLLPPDDAWRLAFVYLATVPLMAMFAFAVYSLLGVPPDRRLTAATLLVLPGMVLDAVTVTAFETLFPNMAPASGPRFGGLLLLANAAVLLTGVVPLRYVGRDGPADGTPDETTDGTAADDADQRAEPAGTDAVRDG